MTWIGARRADNLRHALDRWIEHATRHGYEAATIDARHERA
jgi:hypothetical protein